MNSKNKNLMGQKFFVPGQTPVALRAPGVSPGKSSPIGLGLRRKSSAIIIIVTSITFPDYHINEQYFSLYQFHPFSISSEIQ